MANFSTRPRREALSRDAMLVIAAALLLVLSAASALRAWTQLAAVDATLGETQDLVGRLRDRVKQLQAERGTGPEERLAAQLVLTVQAPAATVLAAIEDALPADVRLEGITLQYDQDVEVEMRVVARRAAAYDEFLTRLSASPRFHDIVPGAESRADTLTAVVKASFRGETK
jgi:hypothetical protein